MQLVPRQSRGTRLRLQKVFKGAKRLHAARAQAEPGHEVKVTVGF